MSADPDIIFVIGMVVALFSIPSLISAFSESRPPRAAAILVMIGAGLIAIAVLQKPGGYRVDDAPKVFFSVVAKLIK